MEWVTQPMKSWGTTENNTRQVATILTHCCRTHKHNRDEVE